MVSTGCTYLISVYRANIKDEVHKYIIIVKVLMSVNELHDI